MEHMRHRDPWPETVALLFGMQPAPPEHWPAARTRRVVAASDDTGEEVGDVSPAEREVLGLLGPRSMTPAELAEALAVRPGTLYTRTSRMQAKGLIVRVGAQWSAAGLVGAAVPTAA